MSHANHIVIAGPTASGKSALALRLALETGAEIVNADALQVYDQWSILTARPQASDLAEAPHHLYGHVPMAADYSVGHWLRDVRSLMDADPTRRLIFVGGSGLYLSALIDGLAEIPAIPDDVRAAADQIRRSIGAAGFLADLVDLDPEILTRIDQRNPMRLQRAWEVATATGRPLSAWQADPTKPILPRDAACCAVLYSDPGWLGLRIDTRFDQMITAGALGECRSVLENGWHAGAPSARALGAQELIDHIHGRISLQEAVSKAKISTRQFAKRQRTWFRARMKDWAWIDMENQEDVASFSGEFENCRR